MRTLISAALAVSLAVACGPQPRTGVEDPDAWASADQRPTAAVANAVVDTQSDSVAMAMMGPAEPPAWEVTEGHVTVVHSGE